MSVVLILSVGIQRSSTYNCTDADDKDATEILPLMGAVQPPPTAQQQAQLDKYGATPETFMEILFNQIMTSSDGNEMPGGDDNPQAKAHWENFLDNMKQLKQEQQRQGRELEGREDQD